MNEEFMSIEEKIDRVRELLLDTEKWKGYAPGSMQRRALTELQSYYELLFKVRRETFEKSAASPGMAPKEPKPLSLYGLVERISKPVFEKDAAGRKEWKILKEIRIDEDGMMCTWTDGGGGFIPVNKEQKYFFGEEVD